MAAGICRRGVSLFKIEKRKKKKTEKENTHKTKTNNTHTHTHAQNKNMTKPNKVQKILKLCQKKKGKTVKTVSEYKVEESC